MKIFYDSTFINKEKLLEAGINHKIKLEYYKITNEDYEKGKKEKFGISIIKKEYTSNKVETEEKSIKYLYNEENKINEILKILREHEVTPIGMKDIVLEFCILETLQKTCKL